MAQLSPASDPTAAPAAHGRVMVNGIALAADCLGALYWRDEGVLIVADLHLEGERWYFFLGLMSAL